MKSLNRWVRQADCKRDRRWFASNEIAHHQIEITRLMTRLRGLLPAEITAEIGSAISRDSIHLPWSQFGTNRFSAFESFRFVGPHRRRPGFAGFSNQKSSIQSDTRCYLRVVQVLPVLNKFYYQNSGTHWNRRELSAPTFSEKRQAASESDPKFGTCALVVGRIEWIERIKCIRIRFHLNATDSMAL